MISAIPRAMFSLSAASAMKSSRAAAPTLARPGMWSSSFTIHQPTSRRACASLSSAPARVHTRTSVYGFAARSAGSLPGMGPVTNRHTSRQSLTAFGGSSSGRRDMASKAHGRSSSKGGSDDDMSPEHQEYWSELMKRIEKPDLVKLLGLLDPTHKIGIRKDSGKARGKDAGRVHAVKLYDYFVEIKTQNPKCMVLVRIGGFFETYGFDALLLCQFAGVQPMGSSAGGTVCSGVPAVNLPSTVRLLNEANLNVVVCDEMPGDWGTRKERFVMGVSTPAHPIIFPAGNSSKEFYTESNPLIGVASSKSGYVFCEYKNELRAVFVTEQLTLEALVAALGARRAAPPLFLHRSVQEIASSGATVAHALRSIKGATQVVHTKTYGGGASFDPVQEFVMEARMEMCLGPQVPILVHHVSQAHQEQGGSGLSRPQPPYIPTITNLGLNKTPGMPNLLDFMTPNTTPELCRRWLKALLRQPPPPAQALLLHQACRHLRSFSAPLPELYAGMSMKKVSEVLRERQANDVFFRELVGLAESLSELFQRPDLEPVSSAVLQHVTWEHRIEVGDRSRMQHQLSRALAEIHRVVDVEGTGASSAPGGEDSDEEAPAQRPGTRQRAPLYDGNVPRALREMVADNERYLGRVNPETVQDALQKVEDIKALISQEVQLLMKPLVQASISGNDLVKHRPALKYSQEDKALWIYLPRPSKAHQAGSQLNLRMAEDRKGKTDPSNVETRKLNDLMAQYLDATADAEEEVQRQLQNLCTWLGVTSTVPRGPSMFHTLVAGTQVSIVARALMEHVTHALQRGWCVPELQPVQEPGALGAAPTSAPSQRLQLLGFFPFWKDSLDASTVRNDLTLDCEVVLLTGPNMAGKSTVLRSVCACSLLGCCGLLVPARRALLPFFDAFILRNYSGDSPLEGLSSFALECVDIRAVLRDSTSRSLVLLDEMGKGTEVDAATALSASLLEELIRRRATVVFATHLHDLVPLLREQEQQGVLRNMCMEVSDVPVPGGRTVKAPSCRIVPGYCYDSMALEVAEQYAVPQAVVARARTLHQGMRDARAQAHANAAPSNSSSSSGSGSGGSSSSGVTGSSSSGGRTYGAADGGRGLYAAAVPASEVQLSEESGAELGREEEELGDKVDEEAAAAAPVPVAAAVQLSVEDASAVLRRAALQEAQQRGAGGGSGQQHQHQHQQQRWCGQWSVCQGG